MTLRLLLSAFVLTLVVAAFAVPGFSEEPTAEEPVAEGPSQAEMEQAWAAMGTPGEHHEWLGFMVGTWNGAWKFWEPGNPEPQTGMGTMTTRWIMGGRFLRCDWSSEMMGTAFTGEATIGYDNGTGTYRSVWIDSMSTPMSIETGEREGDVLKTTGAQSSPMGPIPTRGVTTKISDDEYKMETWWTMPGMGDVKVMELVYRRAP